MKNEMDNKGYWCRRCERSFSALEVQSLINPVTFLFTCDVCSDELEENQRAAGLVSSQELQSRYAFFGVS